MQPRCLNGVGLGDGEVFRVRPNGLPLTLGGQMVEDTEVSRGHGGCEESTGQLGGCEGSVAKSDKIGIWELLVQGLKLKV